MTTIKNSQRFASVWDAIEDSREVAASLKLKAEVASAVIDEIRRRRLTQGTEKDPQKQPEHVPRPEDDPQHGKHGGHPHGH